MCNRSVNFLINIDKKNILLFAPLQGETAKNILPIEQIKNLNSLVFYHKNQFYYKSTAVILSISYIGGVWSLILAFFIFPPFIRNWVYDLIASFRYRIFGKSKNCRVPSESEKAKILK